MPIPKEILAVERPKSTRVKAFGNRYLVIKRTSKIKNGKPYPVELGTIGEIVDGKYVEIRKEPKKRMYQVDIKSYGPYALFNKVCFDLFKDLAAVFDIDVAKRIYVMAMMRAIDRKITNQEIAFTYQQSFISEIFTDLSLSENTISKLLVKIGQEYRYIHKFIEQRTKQFEGKTQVIDGTLVDNNSIENNFSEFSRKAKTKGSKELTLVYSFDIATKEPVAMKTYPGNMLDSRSIDDFLTSFDVKNGLIVMDKGFYTKTNIEKFKEKNALSYIVPLKNSAKVLKDLDIFNKINKLLKKQDEGILYHKVKKDETTYLYAFRNIKSEYEQKLGYLISNEKKDTFDGQKYLDKENQFGTIVLESNIDLTPLEVYLAYSKRWEIETMFKMMKEIISLDTVNVHSDYSVIATEFINFISVIMAQRVKQFLRITKMEPKAKKSETKTVAETYSFRLVIKYLSKMYKTRIGESKNWVTSVLLKYTEELARVLGI